MQKLRGVRLLSDNKKVLKKRIEIYPRQYWRVVRRYTGAAGICDSQRVKFVDNYALEGGISGQKKSSGRDDRCSCSVQRNAF